MAKSKKTIQNIEDKSVSEIVKAFAAEEPSKAMTALTEDVVEIIKGKAIKEGVSYSKKLNKKAGNNAAYQSMTNNAISLVACGAAVAASKALGGPSISYTDPMCISAATLAVSGLSAVVASIRKRIANRRRYRKIENNG